MRSSVGNIQNANQIQCNQNLAPSHSRNIKGVSRYAVRTTNKVYTNQKNLIRDALGLTSNRVYQWRLLLEEHAPEIVHIKGIHNSVADAISRLEYNPEVDPTNERSFANLEVPTEGHRWKGFTALWCSYNEKNPGTHGQVCNLNHVFANRNDEDEIYPLTAQEFIDAQRVDATLKHCF